ncbi:MAG TPA: ABC transporter permease [Thermoleophilaceae bacterium]|jgi:ABC-2 type transport system permease protein
MSIAAHSWYMMIRHLRALGRQPWWIAITLTQPIIWLVLFGSVFKSAANIPGFGDDSYVDFFAPGVVIMTAFFSAGWGGMTMIEDMDRGVIDRFLATPVRLGALITGRTMQGAVVIAIQSAIIVGLALLLGAGFSNGPLGVVGMILVASLLGTSVAALSNGLALVVRREETLIATINVLLFPLTFVSTAFMPEDLLPGWVQTVADVNPLNWAVEAARISASGDDWGTLAVYTGALLALALACAAFATRAFRSYRASL